MNEFWCDDNQVLVNIFSYSESPLKDCPESGIQFRLLDFQHNSNKIFSESKIMNEWMAAFLQTYLAVMKQYIKKSENMLFNQINKESVD